MSDRLDEALNIVVGRTGHVRYRQLCDPAHAAYNPDYVTIVLRLAGFLPPEPDPGPSPLTILARPDKPRITIDDLARAKRNCIPCHARRAPWEDLTWLKRWADAGSDPAADFSLYIDPAPRPAPPGPPIYGWVHVATIGAWETILRELFSQIERSGLRAATSRVFVGVVGPEADLSWFPPWVEIVKRDGPLIKGENTTLQAMWAWAKHAGPGKVWYLHTKGASHPGNAHVTAWRDYMTFFNVLRWEGRAAALDTHDASGVDYVALDGDYQWFLDLWGALRLIPGSRGFPGNFWWATTDYLARLPLGDDMHAHDRWWSEWLFVGTGAPRVQNAHDARHNHYNGLYPRSRYDPGGPRGGDDKPQQLIV